MIQLGFMMIDHWGDIRFPKDHFEWGPKNFPLEGKKAFGRKAGLAKPGGFPL